MSVRIRVWVRVKVRVRVRVRVRVGVRVRLRVRVRTGLGHLESNVIQLPTQTSDLSRSLLGCLRCLGLGVVHNHNPYCIHD